MTNLESDPEAWIVVCDGTKAIILENRGTPSHPDLHIRQVHEQKDPRTSEQGADRPGRFFASIGKVRSAAEQTDWHDRTEKTFLRNLTQELQAAVASGAVKRVVLVAPPRALGVLRKYWPATLRAAVKAELAHDYVKLSIHELEKRLFG